MDRSLSSLTYKGSIPEAITEAKKQKKLFVVYISGEDEESINLESTTWTDLKVVESLSKYCILLHIPKGSTDAVNFCAIYPQESIPSITAIGYNGVQVWKSERFISAEVLASSLEKAWLSLHIQETTATVLSAALASKKSEQPTSATSVIHSPEQGSSSGTAVQSPTSDKHIEPSEARLSVTSDTVKEKNSELVVKAVSVGNEESPSSSKVAKDLHNPVMPEPDNSGAERVSFSAEDGSPLLQRNSDHYSGVPVGGSVGISAEANEVVECEKADDTDDGTVHAPGSCGKVTEISDVHLNIRLPNGDSLQEKFSVTSTLRTVKDYVDRNQASGIGSYDLAIPYPRKVFSNEDLSKSLSELSLFNRQALIVVPHQRASGFQGGRSSSSEQSSSTANANSSNESGGGYFAYIKTVLSYVNPFSYFSGGVSSSSSGQDSQTSMWEYGPNAAVATRRDRPFSANDSTSSGSKSRQPNTSRFGSNIHTLKHDEDDGRFSDRNAFWNGNSTQYGGDNNGK